ncbi:MAG TPA: hypothetical protein VIV11_03840 [Kofleriaceae bacterium]
MLRVIAILLLATSPTLAEPAKRCNADKLEADGNDLFQMGNTAAAFAKYEAAAKCKPSDRIHERAGMAACTLYRSGKSEHWFAKAKLYVGKLPLAKRDRVQRMCFAGCGGPGGLYPTE